MDTLRDKNELENILINGDALAKRLNSFHRSERLFRRVFYKLLKNSDYEINIFSKDQFNLILEAYKKINSVL